MALPDLGKSVNPRRADYAHQIIPALRIFRPSYGPEKCHNSVKFAHPMSLKGFSSLV
jgi:hypothetical protein